MTPPSPALTTLDAANRAIDPSTDIRSHSTANQVANGRTSNPTSLKPIRVAVVHPYPWPEVRRGAERYLDDLSHFLAARGHQVTVVTGTHERARRRHAAGEPSMVFRHHLRPRGIWRFGVTEVETFGAAAVTPLMQLRPDVVHAFTPSAALAGRLARIPTLYTVLGHPDRAQLPIDRVPRVILTAAVNRSTVTATLSHGSAKALQQSLGRHSIVLPPGVRLDRFPPDLRPRTGPPRLLFSASLADNRKRVDLAIGALALLLCRRPDARLVLSGSGDPAAAIETARRLGDDVLAAIEVAGPGSPDEVPRRYREASVTVLPAEHEAFGLALVESLASGTPVVCAPTGGMPELPDDHTGRVAKATTAEALAAAIDETLTLASRNGTPARCVERARRWDWDESVGPAHELLYRHLAGRQELPSAVGPW